MFRTNHSLAETWNTAVGSIRLPFISEFVRLLFSAVRAKWVLLCAAPGISQERKLLLKLTDGELGDMGISRAQAEQEARRAYFDIPANRLSQRGLLDPLDRGDTRN